MIRMSRYNDTSSEDFLYNFCSRFFCPPHDTDTPLAIIANDVILIGLGYGISHMDGYSR